MRPLILYPGLEEGTNPRTSTPRLHCGGSRSHGAKLIQRFDGPGLGTGARTAGSELSAHGEQADLGLTCGLGLLAGPRQRAVRSSSPAASAGGEAEIAWRGTMLACAKQGRIPATDARATARYCLH